MKKAIWAVSPNLTPWDGDLRRNAQPYFYGASQSMSEFSYCQYVKRKLERLGIRCFVELVDL